MEQEFIIIQEYNNFLVVFHKEIYNKLINCLYDTNRFKEYITPFKDQINNNFKQIDFYNLVLDSEINIPNIRPKVWSIEEHRNFILQFQKKCNRNQNNAI